MGMTNKNLCDSCTNIGCMFQSGIVRTECAFYMPPHIEPENCGNYAVMQPTVEAIPKDQYEARLKADMVAMLTEIQLGIHELENPYPHDYDNLLPLAQHNAFYDAKSTIEDLVEQKIDKLKEA